MLRRPGSGDSRADCWEWRAISAWRISLVSHCGAMQRSAGQHSALPEPVQTPSGVLEEVRGASSGGMASWCVVEEEEQEQQEAVQQLDAWLSSISRRLINSSWRRFR